MQGSCLHEVMVRGVTQERKKSLPPRNSSNSRARTLPGRGRGWDGMGWDGRRSCAPGAGEELSLAQMTSSTHKGHIQGAHVLLTSTCGRDADSILQMGKPSSRTQGCTCSCLMWDLTSSFGLDLVSSLTLFSCHKVAACACDPLLQVLEIITNNIKFITSLCNVPVLAARCESTTAVRSVCSASQVSGIFFFTAKDNNFFPLFFFSFSK